MEKLHMNEIRELIYRFRRGDGNRTLARELNLSRNTVRKYRALARRHHFLNPERELPSREELAAVMDQLYRLGYQDDQQVQYSLDSDFLMLNLMDRERSFQVQKGDRLTPGISIGNSETGLSGLSSLQLAAFILRLICTNGLISTSTVESSYRHVSDRILNEFPQVIERLGKDIDRDKERFRISLETPVEHPDRTIHSFNRQFGLNEAEIKAVEWGWSIEQGPMMFAIINSYTKGSQALKLPAESSYRLQRVGGSILAMLN